MPSYTNPFYNPGSIYGGFNPITGNSQDWYNTPLVQMQDLPYGDYERFLTQQGFGGFTNRDQFGRSQYNRAASGYQAAQQSNPDLMFRDYLSSLGSGLDDAYASLSPEQRGQSMPGQTRWVRWG
jgi:hypothetical protein